MRSDVLLDQRDHLVQRPGEKFALPEGGMGPRRIAIERDHCLVFGDGIAEAVPRPRLSRPVVRLSVSRRHELTAGRQILVILLRARTHTARIGIVAPGWRPQRRRLVRSRLILCLLAVLRLRSALVQSCSRSDAQGSNGLGRRSRRATRFPAPRRLPCRMPAQVRTLVRSRLSRDRRAARRHFTLLFDVRAGSSSASFGGHARAMSGLPCLSHLRGQAVSSGSHVSHQS